MSSRKRSPESDSSSDSESDDDDDHHRKHHKSSSHKSSKHHKKDKKKKKKHKKESSSKGPVHVGAPITEDDYFAKNIEFSVWLKKKKGTAFEDLSSEKARKKFKEFVRKWNDGELSQKYYDGMRTGAAAPARTQFKWGFAKQLDAVDRKQLQNLTSEIGNSTDDAATIGSLDGPGAGPGPQPGHQRRAGPQGPAAPSSEDLAQYNRELARHSRKHHRDTEKQVMEEIAPREKGPGREAKMQRRFDRARERQAREVSPEYVRESDLMGGSSDFQQELARRKKFKEDKRQQRAYDAREKVEQHQNKEKEKIAALLAMAREAKSSNALWQG